MKKIVRIVFVLAILTNAKAQDNLGEYLTTLPDFESKYTFYSNSNLSTEQVKKLIAGTTNEREQLELILLFIRRQFLKDISVGGEEAMEGLRLAKKLNLPLHQAMCYANIATNRLLFDPPNIPRQWADSALQLSRKINDKGLESSVYYTHYIIDFNNDDQVSGVINLLKSVELAEKYTGPKFNNNKQVRLLMEASKWKNYELVESQLAKIQFDVLNEEDKSTYIFHQALAHEANGNIDSAIYFYQKSCTLFPNEHTFYEFGKYLKRVNKADSAILLLNKSIDLMDPTGSYLGKRYQVLADIYEEKQDPENVKKYLKLRLADHVRLNEKIDESMASAVLARFYLNNGTLDSAHVYARNAYDMAITNNYSEPLVHATLILAEIEKKLGNHQKSASYLREHIEQTKINSKLEVIKLLKKAEIDKQIKHYTAVTEQKVNEAKGERNLIILVALLLSVFLAVVIKLLLDKRRTLKIQEQLTKKVQEQNEAIMVQDEQLKLINLDLAHANQQLEERVAKRTIELKTLNDQLTKYTARLIQYANLTAHNLRAPLANILGLSKIYGSKNLVETEKESIVQHIEDAATEIDDVVGELNALLELENEGDPNYEWVNLTELESELRAWLEKKTKDTPYDLISNINIEEIYAVKSYLNLSLRELLINAYHYRDHDKKLIINFSAVALNEHIEISIEDNGSGIDLDKFNDKIFKLHQRFHERVNGRGVGLYLVKRQVESLNGSIDVSSQLGAGSRFTIILPNQQVMQN